MKKNKSDPTKHKSNNKKNITSEEITDTDISSKTGEVVTEEDNKQDEEKTNNVADEMELLKKESKENFELYVRKTAEFENHKKRVIKERAEQAKFSNVELIKAFLPVLDNLNRAINATKNGADFNSLIDGVKMTQEQFLSALKKEGVEEIKSMGEQFDPSKHDAIRMIESSEHDENIVLEEYEKGYSLNGRIIQPSKVGVTTIKTPDEVTEATDLKSEVEVEH